MRIIEDKYDGVLIQSDTLPETCDNFKNKLVKLIGVLKGKKLLWIKIPSKYSRFIPILTELEFEFHHCSDNSLMLVKKLVCNPTIPNAMNFNVGVGAIVLDEGLLLVIKDKFSKGYKLPGGHIDPDETIDNALVREVFEETGVKVQLESIINIGHFLSGQFGEQNLYLVCTAKNITREINIQDSSEIIDAKWIDATEFLSSNEVNAYNKEVVNAVINGTNSKLTLNSIKLRTRGEVFL